MWGHYYFGGRIMDVRKKLQLIIKSKDNDGTNTEQKLKQVLEELEQIKLEWTKSLEDLNVQRKKYNELNNELLNIRNEMIKIKNLL